jgi:hypothetical protein
LDLKDILEGQLKKSATSMVRVRDQYLSVKQHDTTKGLLRVIMYLEDLGVSKESAPGQ